MYGSYGTPLSDSSFSIAWQGWGTELLLTTGMVVFWHVAWIRRTLKSLLSGDMSLWAVVDSARLQTGLRSNPLNSHLGPAGTCKEQGVALVLIRI